MHFLMLEIWGVEVYVALGYSYLLAAKATFCDAGSLFAASLHHAFSVPWGFSVYIL